MQRRTKLALIGAPSPVEDDDIDEDEVPAIPIPQYHVEGVGPQRVAELRARIEAGEYDTATGMGWVARHVASR